MGSPNPFLDAALSYAERGISVIPLKPRDKRPAIKTGDGHSGAATTNAATIEMWWNQRPDANVGIVLEPSRLVVLDVDGPQGQHTPNDLARQHSNDLSPSATTKTGRGQHIYYSVPDGFDVPPSTTLGTKLDFLAAGKLVVAAPSVHPTGAVYIWLSGLDMLTNAPLWLLNGQARPATPQHQLATHKPKSNTSALRRRDGLCRELREAPEGNRNNRLNHASYNLGRLVASRHLERSHIEDQLLDAARTAGLDDTEASDTIASGLESGIAAGPDPDHHERVEVVIGPDRTPTPTPGDKPMPDLLRQCLDTYRKWMWFPHAETGTDYIVASLGAVAANILPGDPVWLLLVGAPGSGKTEAIQPLAKLDYIHPAATVSEASLLSGVSKQSIESGATGGLLRQVDKFGILLVKDLSGLLSEHRDTRARTLAALREVFDGSWSRPVGTGGGKVLQWNGKCGLIGAVTPSIDRHHAVLGALGERFMLHRVHIGDATAQARRRLANRGQETQMRAELAEAVTVAFGPVGAREPRTLTEDETDQLVRLAQFAAVGRTAVERDGYRREVLTMPEAEAPGRLAGSMSQLVAGIEAVGAATETAWRIITKTAWDSIPDVRRRLLHALHATDELIKTAALTEQTGIPRATAQLALEDLTLLGLAESEKAGSSQTAAWTWRLSNDARQLWPSEFHTKSHHPEVETDAAP